MSEREKRMGKALRAMLKLEAKRDKDGTVALVKPLSWETVGRMCLDLAHAGLGTGK